jgi:hypothetical protein
VEEELDGDGLGQGNKERRRTIRKKKRGKTPMNG